VLSVTYGRTIFSAEYFTTFFFHLFSVNNALRNAYKMMVSVKLSLNVINQYRIETSGGVYIKSTHF
jgi:hypothetical protein